MTKKAEFMRCHGIHMGPLRIGQVSLYKP